MKFGENCEIWSKLWNLVKIVKFGQNSQIWSKFSNLAEILWSDQKVKLGQKILKFINKLVSGYLWVQGGYLSVLGGYLGGWVNQVVWLDRWMGRSGGWVCQVARWVRKASQVGIGWFCIDMYGLVRSAWLLNQNSQWVSESVSESVSQRGGYRAARAAKKWSKYST